MEKDKIELFDIQDVEIFASGTWNGDKYTDNDLDNMVTAFNETKDKLKPYLKLGHDENQKLIQSDGLPSGGWVSSIKRVGTKLLADFAKIPKKIYELIKRGAYRRVSSEIFWNLKLGDKVYPRALKAVSLLGGDTPAVETLDDILSLYTFDKTVFNEIKNIESKQYSLDINQEEEIKKMAEIKELEEKVTELSKVIETKDGDIAKLADENVKLNTVIKENETAAIRKEIEMIVDNLITEKKMLPADKDKAIQKLFALRTLAEQKKYKVGEKEVSLYEMEIEDLGKQSIKLNTDGQSEMGANTPKEDNSELAEKANKYAKDNNVSYKEALQAVSRRA